MKSYISRLQGLVLILCLAGTSAFAQGGATGALQGEVLDASGAAVAEATVTATQVATGSKRETRTGTSGDYRLASLPVGEYSMRIEARGFQQYVRSGIQIESAVIGTVNVSLQVGEISQQVMVTEDAPLINTTQSTTYRQINTLELLEVPSSSRNFTHLLSAEAGVTSDLPPVSSNDTGALSPSVNGLRTTSNSLQFNGIDATNLLSNEGSLTENISPAPETIQEVKLQTSMYDVSTGRNGGGNFQIVTKGGTNQLHGSGYYFGQHEALNANDFFFNRDGIEKPKARRQETGFTLGGPLVRDRVHLFGGYQYTTADTAFVSTGSSQADLPLFLDYITDRSTPAAFTSNILSAVNAARNACGIGPLGSLTVSSVGAGVFSLANPVTGGFVIPGPGAPSGFCPRDEDGDPILDATSNPIVRVRQVQPSQFKQNQFTTRADVKLSDANSLNGVFFFSNFPSRDSFPDPSSLASPFTLLRNNRARTIAIGDTHVINATTVNDLRFGYLSLNNTRSLDDTFLTDAMSGAALGINNPALAFDDSPGTRRLGHFVFRGPKFSFGGPNDSFNKRQQQTFSVADTLSWQRGSHALRFGVEYRHHNVRNNLPEEQATEFEKIANFNMLIAGLTPEADTQFGITEKEFNSMDLSWFVGDDWKIARNLTLNLGLRWDWFGWPQEKNGLFGNFDPTIADTENPIANGFLVPKNVNTTGLSAAARAVIDPSVAASTQATNQHTLSGQDLNNFQPRLGFAWSPLMSDRLVVRGGYGVFFDRPSAAFINTVFSNYPFLREVEVTAPTNAVPIATAFSQQLPSLPFVDWMPMRPVFRCSSSDPNSCNYEMRDNSGVTTGATGGNNPSCEPNGISGGGPCSGNIAETFEFRAIDRDLKTPYIQQWNLGVQYEITRNLMWEIRYVGTKGTKLLTSTTLAQPWDLNSPDAPDSVYNRLNQAYINAGSPRGALGSQTLTAEQTAACNGRSSCLQGVGLAYGFPWGTGSSFGPLSGTFDMNLNRTPSSASDSAVITADARVIYLGLNTPEAVILKSIGNSNYNALQTNLTHRLNNGLQFNLGYTFSRSIDDNSADPGSTSGGGKPDVPNTGFVVQGDSRNLKANRALSDFDRTHRFSLSFVYNIPTGGSNSQLFRGWQVAGFTQVQSGTPYSIFTSEPEARTAAALQAVASGSGGLYRLGFARPNLAPGASLSDLTDTGEKTMAFDKSLLASPLGGFGTLGRNVLRGSAQKRFDLSISKTTSFNERYNVEFRWEIFNLFNNVNFALPVNDLQDTTSVGHIENTIGGPRVMQFGARFVF